MFSKDNNVLGSEIAIIPDNLPYDGRWYIAWLRRYISEIWYWLWKKKRVPLFREGGFQQSAIFQCRRMKTFSCSSNQLGTTSFKTHMSSCGFACGCQRIDAYGKALTKLHYIRRSKTIQYIFVSNWWMLEINCQCVANDVFQWIILNKNFLLWVNFTESCYSGPNW